jgi:glycosyltransferase involved in cell wall biosynthesis
MTIAELRGVTEQSPDASAGTDRLRVLHVHSGNLWGGVETMLVALAAERDRCARLQPEYALCFDGALRERLAATGVRVYALGEARWRSPGRIVAARRRLGAVLSDGGYDAVITHSMWAHGLFAPVIRRAAPLVYWAHDYIDGKHWLQRWARLTPPELVIANSRFTAESVRTIYPAVPARVVHYPLSLRQAPRATREPIRSAFGTPPGATVIVQVSRLEAWKGHEMLLDALRRLADRNDWQCWIVGGAQRPAEHAYLASLQRRAAAGGIAERERVDGHRTDVPAILAAADVFCQPNASPEPFGIVLVEALAAGLPVVAAASGGACEIVNVSCGELATPGDPAALAGVLRRLLDDPAARRRLGSSGPARAAALCDPGHQLHAIAHALGSVRPHACRTAVTSHGS